MDVKVEKLSGCQARVAFTVPADEFEQEVKRALRQLGQRTRMKGFRPGKVPLAVVEKNYGKEVRAEAKDHFFHRAIQEAVKENDLRLLRNPDAHPDHDPQPEGEPFDMEFEVTLRPEIDLADYSTWEFDAEHQEVTDEDIDAALEELERNQSHPEAVGEEGLPEDGVAICAIRLLDGDEVVLEREGMRFSPQTPVAGIDGEAFAKALTGAAEGAELELPMTIPEGFEKPELVGKEVRCALTVSQAFRIVPPTEEELFKLVGVEDRAALRAKAREQLEATRDRAEERRIEDAALARLVQEHEFELPAGMVEQQAASRLESLRQELEEAELDPAQIQERLAGAEGPATEEAQRAARGYFLIEAIAQKEGLLVTEEDLRKEFQDIAERNRAQPNEVQEYYQKQGLLQHLAMEIVERKVREHLRATVVVRGAP